MLPLWALCHARSTVLLSALPLWAYTRATSVSSECTVAVLLSALPLWAYTRAKSVSSECTVAVGVMPLWTVCRCGRRVVRGYLRVKCAAAVGVYSTLRSVGSEIAATVGCVSCTESMLYICYRCGCILVHRA